MRAWGGDSGGRWGDDDSYDETRPRSEWERDRRRNDTDRKAQNEEKWTPEREKQNRGWQDERSIKGGNQNAVEKVVR